VSGTDSGSYPMAYIDVSSDETHEFCCHSVKCEVDRMGLLSYMIIDGLCVPDSQLNKSAK
jgi:hypothetical protein